MPAADEITVGIVGCGRCTVFGHLPALAKMRDRFRVVAVCDVEKSRRERIERDFPDVRHYRRLEDMVEERDLRLVLIATPTLSHEAMSIECLGRGLWTVCETPVALSHDGALALRGASHKAGGRLIPAIPSLFSNEFRLASMAASRKDLGSLYDIRIRHGQYCRRRDWQATLKRAGGALHFAAQEPVLQALSLLHAPPVQMWSETKKIVSLGDAEDYVRLLMRTADGVTADIEVNSAEFAEDASAITLRGTRGFFSVMPGAASGRYRMIDPSLKFEKQRSSVALPPLEVGREDVRIIEEEMEIPDPMSPYEAFWGAVYAAATGERPFPVDFDLVVEMVRYIGIAGKPAPIAI